VRSVKTIYQASLSNYTPTELATEVSNHMNGNISLRLNLSKNIFRIKKKRTSERSANRASQGIQQLLRSFKNKAALITF
jgi:hypothetical protein